MTSQDPNPAWLDANNDPSDEESENETTPLFGTGPLPEEDKLEVKDIEQASEDYGAVNEETKEDKKEKEDDSKWHQDDFKGKKKSKAKKKASKAKAAEVISKSKSFQEFLHRPPKPCFLHVFHFVEVISILSCNCLLATQVLPLFLVPVSTIGYLQLALRSYIAFFCVILMLVEFHANLPFLKQSPLLQSYFSRGFLYSFLGLIGMEEAFSVMVEDKLAHDRSEFSISWASLFMNLSSWLIVSVGVIYMLMGICCMERLRKKLSETYQERLEAYRSLNQP